VQRLIKVGDIEQQEQRRRRRETFAAGAEVDR
jgi:hypothetical protein